MKAETLGVSGGPAPKKKDRHVEYAYPQVGCYVNPVAFGCLSCPLPTCLHDDHLGAVVVRRQAADLDIVDAIVHEGLTIQQAAARFATTHRTLWNIADRTKDAFPMHIPGQDHDGCDCQVVREVAARFESLPGSWR